MKTELTKATLRSLARWCAVGAIFTALTVPILYFFRDILRLPLMLATALAWELGTFLRFFVTDRWVFEQPTPDVKRFVKYHVAVGGSFVIWWSATNVLARCGVHYLVASVLATGCSVLWSLTTNYLWVWRRGPATPEAGDGRGMRHPRRRIRAAISD